MTAHTRNPSYSSCQHNLAAPCLTREERRANGRGANNLAAVGHWHEKTLISLYGDVRAFVLTKTMKLVWKQLGDKFLW